MQWLLAARGTTTSNLKVHILIAKCIFPWAPVVILFFYERSKEDAGIIPPIESVLKMLCTSLKHFVTILSNFRPLFMFMPMDGPLPFREDRGSSGGGGQDGPIGAGGPDVPAGGEAPPSGERPRLKLAPRSKPATGQAAAGAAAPAPASSKKASIFGGGKAHDEFAYEVSDE